MGSTTCDSVVTSIAFGSSTTAAHAAIASDRIPPSGKPTNTFARSVPRSSFDHFSSTAPEEKKKTSYGVIAAPNNATAKYQYERGLPDAASHGWAAPAASSPQSGFSR